MNIEDRIVKIKNRAARLAVRVATAATLISGASVASSCSENRNSDENKDKVENVEGEKTSVVFRSKQVYHGGFNRILLENGDILEQETGVYKPDAGQFLAPGDTVTYNGNKVKAVRYKDGNGKQVNFGQIGKMGKGITD